MTTQTVRTSVNAAFRGYSEKHEGRTRNPYADVYGLVTVSVGCLIDPIALALKLPWQVGGRAATQAEVEHDWAAVKALGRNNRSAASQAVLTTIRLNDDGVDSLLWRRLSANVEWLRSHLFPDFPALCADAQLGILSIAWALGCDFLHTDPPRPELVAAISARDWTAAKVYGKLREAGNAGVIGRNRDQELLFDNAAVVEQYKLDPEVLNWPATVIPPVTITGADGATS